MGHAQPPGYRGSPGRGHARPERQRELEAPIQVEWRVIAVVFGEVTIRHFYNRCSSCSPHLGQVVGTSHLAGFKGCVREAAYRSVPGDRKKRAPGSIPASAGAGTGNIRIQAARSGDGQASTIPPRPTSRIWSGFDRICGQRASETAPLRRSFKSGCGGTSIPFYSVSSNGSGTLSRQAGVRR